MFQCQNTNVDTIITITYYVTQVRCQVYMSDCHEPGPIATI